MQLLAGTLGGTEGYPKLQLSDAVAPVLTPLAVTLASYTAVLKGESAAATAPTVTLYMSNPG